MQPFALITRSNAADDTEGESNRAEFSIGENGTNLRLSKEAFLFYSDWSMFLSGRLLI